MGFSIDHNDTFDGGILPVGEYEVVILAAYEDTTKDGKIYINIPLAVRNDVEQGYKNARIWHKLWKRKEPTSKDRQCGDYSARQINSLSKAIGLANGKSYKSLDEWLQELRHMPLRVKIKHGKWNDKPQIEVDELSATKFVKCTHTYKQNETESRSSIFPVAFSETVDEEDTPF